MKQGRLSCTFSSEEIYSKFSKIALATVAVSTITVTSAFADKNVDTKNMKKIYHVYMNNEYVGAVTDKAYIETKLKDMVLDAKQEYSNLDFAIDNEIVYIPEQVFTSATDNESVLKKISDSVVVEAEAHAIMLNNNPIVYVKDEKAAAETVRKLKLNFVTEEQLKDLEARQASPTESLPRLQEDKTRLLDVKIKETVSYKDGHALPKDILTPDQAVQYLLKGTLTEQKYAVQEGDVLGSIAIDHELTTEQLLKLNPDIDEETVLQIGQELNVTVYKPLLNVIVQKEVQKVEVVPYEKEVIEDSSMYKGDMKVKQEGQEGERSVTYVVNEQNGVQSGKEVKEEKILKEPVDYVVIRGTKVVASRGTGSFAWPTNGGYISSRQGPRWGKFHKGIDIARPNDYTIKAVDNGVVTFAGWDGGYGYKVVVDHNNGYETIYAHLNSISVSVGQTIPQGGKLGVMGATGESTGTHLHLEVYKNGTLVNPLSLF